MSSEESEEVSRLLDREGGPSRAREAMLPAQHASQAQAKTSIFKLTYSDGTRPKCSFCPRARRS